MVNKLHQSLSKHKNVKNVIGVIGKNGKLSLELSDEPSLGQWMINVEMNDQKSQKYFQVEKYGIFYFLCYVIIAVLIG